MKNDKLIAIHNGALGDFLCAWPALLALARGLRPQPSEGGAQSRAHGTARIAATPEDFRGRDPFGKGALPPAPHPPKRLVGLPAGCAGARQEIPKKNGAPIAGNAPETDRVRSPNRAGTDTPAPGLDAAPRLLFAGAAERMRWLAPLGYAPCPPDMRRALEGLYGDAREWPHALNRATAAWFCLDRIPAAAHPRIVPLPCLTPGTNAGDRSVKGRGAGSRGAPFMRHVTDALRYRLEHEGHAALPGPPRWDAEWPATWQRLFGGWEGTDSRTVILMPGAGHRAKQWPSERFAAVAGALALAGFNPLYVLGPAEKERGLARAPLMPEGRALPVAMPANLDELTRLLRRAQLVVGNDSGPLHLAALHGTPVLALFGPAPAAAWQPHGATALTSPLECAPCSATLRTLGCAGGCARTNPDGAEQASGAMPCMTAITVDAVLDAVRALLAAHGQRNGTPGACARSGGPCADVATSRFP